MNHRKSPHLADAEAVIGDLRDCVAEYRWRGVKTQAALQIVAEHWGVAARRIRTLFYRDQAILVSRAERHRLALSAAALLDHIADELTVAQQRCQAKADAIRHREQQLTLPLGNGAWGHSGCSPRKRAA